MDGRFRGRVALVTGAASGIGRATAFRLASEGARLVIADRDEAGLALTLATLGEGHEAIAFDAADSESCRLLVERAASDGIDILCNIAGVLDWGITEDFDEARFERLMRINLFSVYALCRAALPHLCGRRGNIVNMASAAGLTGIAYHAAYAASKHGVVGLTRSFAIEYAARAVRVNAVCPGQVDTPMTRQKPPSGAAIDWALLMRAAPKLEDGICDPEDVARAVAYLASDDARRITGITLAVDGGQLAG